MPKRNVRGDDWIWVDRTRKEQEQLGNKAIFAYHGQRCSDAKIRKEINRHVKTLQQQQYSYAPMPAKPEGWVVTICTPTPAPTARSSSSQIPKDERSTDHSRTKKNPGQTGQATNNPGYLAFSAGSTSLKEQSDRRRINTTMLSDIDVEIYIQAALEDLLRYQPIFEGFDDDLQHLSICLDRGERNYSPKVLQRAFIWACRNRRDHQVTALLSRGVSPDSRDEHGEPCLMVAVSKGYENIVRRLIQFGATVDLTDRSGRTSWSIIHHHSKPSEAIAFLLSQAGAKLYIGNILDAAADGHTNEVQSMIDRGADPSYSGIRTSSRGTIFYNSTTNLWKHDRLWTPLHWAVYKGNYEVVEVLIRKRANINARSLKRCTPLKLASRGTEIYKLLVANGATTVISSYDPKILEKHPAACFGQGKVLGAKLDEFGVAEDTVCSVSTSMAQVHIDPQGMIPREPFKNNEKAADIIHSPMSWQPTTMVGSPEILKGSPYPISRYLGSSAGSAAVSIKGSFYRSSAHDQASLSLRAILTKNNQGLHKSWATPPINPPQW